MKRAVKVEGGYLYHGKVYPKLIGSRAEVFHDKAIWTEGRKQKADFMMNRWGEIVSVVKHNTAKAENRLEQFGYKPGFHNRGRKRDAEKMAKP